MSFGWSAGDVVAAAKLINDIVSCIRDVGGAREHFQELVTELQGLKKALDEINELATSSREIPEISALKFASAACGDTLERFYDKIKPFKQSLGSASTKGKVRAAPRMVLWELLLKKEVPELRSYLVAHVGYLNLQLNTALLKVTSTAHLRTQQHYTSFQESAHATLQSIHAEAIAVQQTSVSDKNTLPKLDELLSIMSNTWKSDAALMSILVELRARLPIPHLQFTWAQAPVKLEDALGRTIPVPSEYGWETVEAIIRTQFSKGPGSKKVQSGDYELFNSVNGSSPISASSFYGLIPGETITMAIIIGQYWIPHSPSNRMQQICPRCAAEWNPEVRTQMRHMIDTERIIRVSYADCHRCGSTIRISQKSLPRPLKPPVPRKTYSSTTSVSGPRFLKPSTASIQSERMVFKHLSIYLTDLPETPIRAIPRGITRISISPNTDVFIDNTTGKLLDRAAVKGLDQNMEAETVRSKIARRGEANVDNDVPLRYPSIDVARSSNAMVGVAHSYGGNDIIGDFHSSSPSAAYSYAGVSAGLGYMPKLEARSMRDFECCGQTLPTLHDLLEHYEAAHAQQTPQSIRPIYSTVGVNDGGEREALAIQMSSHWLRKCLQEPKRAQARASDTSRTTLTIASYHKTHGHQNHQLHENGDGTFSILNPETSKPYPGTPRYGEGEAISMRSVRKEIQESKWSQISHAAFTSLQS